MPEFQDNSAPCSSSRLTATRRRLLKNVNGIVAIAEVETHRSEPAFIAGFSTISAGERVVRRTRATLNVRCSANRHHATSQILRFSPLPPAGEGSGVRGRMARAPDIFESTDRLVRQSNVSNKKKARSRERTGMNANKCGSHSGLFDNKNARKNWLSRFVRELQFSPFL